MNKIIKIYILLFAFILSCKAQDRTFIFGKNKANHQSSTIADVDLQTDNSYWIKFKKKGKFGLENLESNLNPFYINLNNSIIKFKYPYRLIVENYQGRNDLLISLKKKNNNEYQLDILQYTKHTTIDKIYFKKLDKNKFEIVKIENIQPGVKSYICEYPKSLYLNKKIINLIQDSINSNCSYR